MRNTAGIAKLLIQYLKKGLVVAARNLKCRLNKMKLAMFQLMMNIPIEMPTIAAPSAFTLPRYSGARYNESAPKLFIKVPLTVLNKTNQKMSNTWYFLKCRNNS